MCKQRIQFYHWSLVLPDLGADKPPEEYNSAAMRAFLKAVGNSRSGETVTSVGRLVGLIESVDNRRNHVVFVDIVAEAVHFAKVWTLSDYNGKQAPAPPRLSLWVLALFLCTKMQ